MNVGKDGMGDITKSQEGDDHNRGDESVNFLNDKLNTGISLISPASHKHDYRLYNSFSFSAAESMDVEHSTSVRSLPYMLGTYYVTSSGVYHIDKRLDGENKTSADDNCLCDSARGT